MEPKELTISGHREKNVIHYMAGFVAVRLMKRYSKRSTNPKLQRKIQLFLGVLKNTRAEEQPYCEDYTKFGLNRLIEEDFTKSTKNRKVIDSYFTILHIEFILTY